MKKALLAGALMLASVPAFANGVPANYTEALSSALGLAGAVSGGNTINAIPTQTSNNTNTAVSANYNENSAAVIGSGNSHSTSSAGALSSLSSMQGRK